MPTITIDVEVPPVCFNGMTGETCRYISTRQPIPRCQQFGEVALASGETAQGWPAVMRCAECRRAGGEITCAQ